MAGGKPHLEFTELDMDQGWETPPGYPEGIKQKILASDLDEQGNLQVEIEGECLHEQHGNCGEGGDHQHEAGQSGEARDLLADQRHHHRRSRGAGY